MVWKVTGKSDGGRADVHGGRDADKVSRTFNGELDVDDININSPFYFLTGKHFWKNSLNAYGYQIIVPVLSGVANHVQMSAPQLPSGTASDALTSNASVGELINKILDIRKNTVKGAAVAAATGKKTGQIVCGQQLGASAGSDLFAGHIDRPAVPTIVRDAAPAGIGWEYSTGSTANTVTGIEFAGAFMRREFSARVKAKMVIPTSTANTRLYVGLSSDITIPNSNTPLANTDSGVIVGWRSTDTNIMIFHNGGAAAGATTPTVVNTGIPKTGFTAARNIEVLCRNSVPEVEVTVLEPTGNMGLEISPPVYTTKLSSNIPLEQANMSPTVTLQNSDPADHKFRIYGVEGDQTM